MDFDRDSLIRAAQIMDQNNELGLVAAIEAQPDLNVPSNPDRFGGSELLENAADVATIILALRFLIGESHRILKEIEKNNPDKSSVWSAFQEALRERYLRPAKKNKATIQTMIEAVVDLVKEKLNIKK